jgi:hypothetical protein
MSASCRGPWNTGVAREIYSGWRPSLAVRVGLPFGGVSLAAIARQAFLVDCRTRARPLTKR